MKFVNSFGKKFLAFIMTLIVATSSITAIDVASVDAKESTEYNIKVNLGTNCTTIYKDGKPIKAMICSPSDETPVGTFYTPIKYEWHDMIGNCYAQYCTRITGQVLFHSVWYYKKYDKSTMSVAAYNVMGNKASHGCVRLLCEDAKWIYDNCALNTRVDIFWGDADDDPLPRPGFTPITTGAFTAWDPTDPDPANPWNKAKPTITQVKKNIEYNSKIKPIDTVEIKDSLGNTLTKSNASIKISGKINTKKLGTYKVSFNVTDKLNNNRKVTLTYKVVDTKQPTIKGAKNVSSIPAGMKVNLKSNVTAKTATGKNITKRIKITVTNASTKKKVKVTNGYATFKNPGKYTVKYKVAAPNGRTRTKNVKYTVVSKKVKAELKTSKAELEYGSTFTPYSYIKSLKTYKGGKLGIHDKNVSVSGKVDTAVPGTYVIKYTFSNYGNKYTVVTKNLTVVVKAKVAEETTTEEETTEPEQTTEEETTAEGETIAEVTP